MILNQGNVVAQGAPSELRSTLERGGRVMVRVSAPSDAVLPIIQGLPEVARAEVSAESIVVLPANLETDPRPAIARAVIEKGWDLIELRPLAVNLEEIFLELTQQESAAEEAPAQPTENEVAS